MRRVGRVARVPGELQRLQRHRQRQRPLHQAQPRGHRLREPHRDRGRQRRARRRHQRRVAAGQRQRNVALQA